MCGSLIKFVTVDRNLFLQVVKRLSTWLKEILTRLVIHHREKHKQINIKKKKKKKNINREFISYFA